MTAADAFSVIESPAPGLEEDDARAFLREQNGLEGSLQSLISERDQNFRVRAGDGRQFVFKIAGSREAREVTEFQVAALVYLEKYIDAYGIALAVPRVYRTLDGRSHVEIEIGGSKHLCRVVSFLDGEPLAGRPPSQHLCRDMGASLARLGQALADFDHPGSEQALIWDMRRAPELRQILEHVADDGLRALVSSCLDDFEELALPHFAELRSQVIHSDLNPDNVLVDADDPDRMAGIIDFGDMLRCPLVVDVAVAASYLRAGGGNPLQPIAAFLYGYHAVTPLERREVDLLYDLIRTRMVASIVIMAWRASVRAADEPYLKKSSRGEAGEFLQRFSELPREHVRQAFRQTCASVENKS